MESAVAILPNAIDADDPIVDPAPPFVAVPPAAINDINELLTEEGGMALNRNSASMRMCMVSSPKEQHPSTVLSRVCSKVLLISNLLA